MFGMWLNCSHIQVNPGDTDQVVAMLSRDASLKPLQAAQGFCAQYVVESTEIPGELISITIWENAEEGQAYLASPECQRVVESLQEYLVRPLERSYYVVSIEASNPNRIKRVNSRRGGEREI
jgi:quinol monooxygenase YgiN